MSAADRYEREREKVRASKMPAHAKAARLAYVDIKEERHLSRTIKRSERKLVELRDRVAAEREERERQRVRDEMRSTWHRALSRYEDLPEHA